MEMHREAKDVYIEELVCWWLLKNMPSLHVHTYVDTEKISFERYLLIRLFKFVHFIATTMHTNTNTLIYVNSIRTQVACYCIL